MPDRSPPGSSHPDPEVPARRSTATWLFLLSAAFLTLPAVPATAAADPGAAARTETEESRAMPQDTAAILQAARAFFPDSVGGGERLGVKLMDYAALDELARVTATYDHPGMPYAIAVYFYSPGDSALVKRMKKMQRLGGGEPQATHQGTPVYEWPYEGMGSGVGLRVEGELDAWVQVSSPRLTEEMREKAGGREEHPAPPPEAGLRALDLEGRAFRALVERVAAAHGSGG